MTVENMGECTVCIRRRGYWCKPTESPKVSGREIIYIGNRSRGGNGFSSVPIINCGTLQRYLKQQAQVQVGSSTSSQSVSNRVGLI
jgi:hypothetical protein